MAEADRKRPLVPLEDVICRAGLRLKGRFVMATVLAVLDPDPASNFDFAIVLVDAGCGHEYTLTVRLHKIRTAR